MKLYVEFMKEIELARPGASEQVSEVDLSDAQDVRATLTGLPGSRSNADPGAFRRRDFVNRYHLLLENIDAVARQRRARGIGGSAILAAGGGESGKRYAVARTVPAGGRAGGEAASAAIWRN